MTKLKPHVITETDLAQFVANDSDFDFEMRVLNRLRALQFECWHSGTYQDPVSDKIRQFDIRARRVKGNCILELAVECKNLRPNHPLLLSAVPRTTTESFHQVIEFSVPTSITSVRTVKLNTAYSQSELVGKKTDQVGRDGSGDLVGDDGATFDKLNQAVNSCNDLVRKAAIPALEPRPCFRTIVPVLVVPQDLLWQVDYDEYGNLRERPRRVKSSSLFIDHAWTMYTSHGPIDYRLSHLEIVTHDGLPRIVDHWLGPSGFFAEWKDWLGA